MLDLRERGRDIRCFVANLEQVVIDTLAAFNITGERRDGPDRGLGAAARTRRRTLRTRSPPSACACRNWVSFHGLSLNVAPDLGHYAGIVPCGISDHGVTSFEDLGQIVSMEEVDTALRTAFAGRFGALERRSADRRLSSFSYRLAESARFDATNRRTRHDIRRIRQIPQSHPACSVSTGSAARAWSASFIFSASPSRRSGRIDHFFATFPFGFGDGLWGLLEIAVFGLFGIIVLRVICEALIVYFEANKDAVRTRQPAEVQTSLIDEVRDAIEQLGEEDDRKRRLPETAKRPSRPGKPAAQAAAAKTRQRRPRAHRPRPARHGARPRTAKRSPKPQGRHRRRLTTVAPARVAALTFAAKRDMTTPFPQPE